MRRFKKVYVEVTNVCNLNCSFCPKTKREKKEMSQETFEMVLKKIKPHTDYIYMHVMGEPFCHSKIDSLIDMCENYGIKVNITTNGTMLKTCGEKIIAKPALRQINISIHSFENNNLDKFEEYMHNIFEFIRKTQNQKSVIFCLRLWNLNSEGELLINKKAKELLKEEFNVSSEIVSKVTDRNGITLKKNVYLQQEERFVWPSVGGEEVFKKGSCFGLKTHIGILSDGTVIPCCIDSEGTLSLGNIMDSSIEEILDSERAIKIFEGFKKSTVEEKFCKTCGFRHNA